MEHTLFETKLNILNVGTPLFQKEIARQQVPCLHVDWKPAAGGDIKLIEALDRLLEDEQVNEANRLAVEKIKQAHPVLVDVDQAIRVIPGMTEKTILHAGPPIAYHDMCGPMRGAIMGALMYEGLAATAEEADRLAASGEITFSPCHEHHAVGPMAGVISPSMPVHVVKNVTDGNYSYATINEGLGKVLRFGANSPEVLDRLRYIEKEFAPVLKAVVALAGGVDIKNLTAQALHMGDECHNRNKAATALLIRDLLPCFLDESIDRAAAKKALAFMRGNEHYFLNLSMPACKCMMEAAHGVPKSTVVTVMARNGVEFGIKVSGMPADRWFTGPAQMGQGLMFPGFH